jgi:hypothetical protein
VVLKGNFGDGSSGLTAFGSSVTLSHCLERLSFIAWKMVQEFTTKHEKESPGFTGRLQT